MKNKPLSFKQIAVVFDESTRCPWLYGLTDGGGIYCRNGEPGAHGWWPIPMHIHEEPKPD